MFAPHHPASARELLRVTRPGGRIGLLNWTPEGFIGQMFATMKPFAPAPPPGAQPPPLWGDEQHVRGLLGDEVVEVKAQKRRLDVSLFDTPEALRDYFKAYYGPTISTYKSIAADPARVDELDAALVDLVRRFARPGPGLRLEWEYLLLTARKRA
jgi:hypothetical protein